MNKALGFVVFMFLSLVTLNWFFSSLGNNSFAPSFPTARSDSSLAAINFAIFNKTGTKSHIVTQGYGRTPYSGQYPNDWHDGIDIAASYGTPIDMMTSGVVIATGNQDTFCYHRGFGKYVAVKDNAHNLILWFAHLGTIAVSPGQSVTRDDLIGTVGATGLETGPHLHFSIFDANGFSMTVRNGCGPEPTGRDLDPFDYLGTTYQ
jgi:murein DD-endopeptidase MepM/ murein hydrolase activator NlpD